MCYNRKHFYVKYLYSFDYNGVMMKKNGLLLVDYNGVAVRGLTYMLERETNRDLDENDLRPIIINSIRESIKNFSNRCEDIVICCDSGSYWRKDFFEYYKYNRIALKKNSKFDWNLIHNSLKLVKNEMIEGKFPYKIIDVNKCEGDDIIGVLTRYKHNDYKSVIIISADGDFTQLHSYKNVSQYNPLIKTEVKPNYNPHRDLMIKCFKGDPKDGIPNIHSPKNFYYTKDVTGKGKRQKSISSKQIDFWIDNDLRGLNEFELERYELNKLLVDLSMIPKEYVEEILEQFDKPVTGSLRNISKYLSKNNMKKMIEFLNHFSPKVNFT